MEPLLQREMGISPKEGFLRQMHFSQSQAQRLQLERVLDAHQGCVNRLAWNQEGTRLASGSDDRKVMIWSAPGPAMPPLSVSTHHRANIFGVQFLPCTGDSKIVTAAMDHTVQLHELNRADASLESDGLNPRSGRSGSPSRPVVAEQRSSQVFYCHTNRVKDVKVEPFNPHNFWSAGEDGMVRQFDTRCSSQTTHDAANVLVYASHGGAPVELKALDINKAQPHLMAVSCGDPFVRVFDRRMLSVGRPPTRGSAGTAPLLKLAPTHLTCSAGGLHRTHSTYLQFSSRGDKIVTTYHSDHAYTFDLLGAMTATLRQPSTGVPAAEKHPIKASFQPAADTASSSASPSASSPGGIERLPDAAEAARRRGNRAMFEDDWCTAVSELSTALEVAPWCASLHARRAEALLARKWPGDDLWALQDCEEAISLDPHGCPLAYFRRVRALQSLKQLQCARLALDQYKALFPERCSADDVAATSAALETQLRQRQRKRELWRQQRKHETRARKDALRSIGEGRHTPRPRRSPTPPPQQASSPPVTAPLSPDSIQAADESEPFIGPPPPPPRTAWGEEVASDTNATSSAPTVAVSAVPDGTTSSSSPEQPVGARSASDTFGTPFGQEPFVVASSSMGADQDAAAPRSQGAQAAQTAGPSHASLTDDQRLSSQPGPSNGSAAPAPQAPVHNSPGASPSSRPAAGVGDSSDSESDTEGDNEEDEEDHPDNPCREVLLPLYTRVCAGTPGSRSPGGTNPSDRASQPAASSQGMREALRANMAQRFIGQVNLQTDIKEAVFLGQGDRLVACGSDDGRVYIYCAETGLLLRALEADEDVVNCCQPHPHCTLLATSGIENVIRLWSPGAEPSRQEAEALRELVANNQARNQEGPAVLRASHLRALADSPHLYELLLAQLYNRQGDRGQDEDDDESDPRAEVSCRVN